MDNFEAFDVLEELQDPGRTNKSCISTMQYTQYTLLRHLHTLRSAAHFGKNILMHGSETFRVGGVLRARRFFHSFDHRFFTCRHRHVSKFVMKFNKRHRKISRKTIS